MPLAHDREIHPLTVVVTYDNKNGHSMFELHQ